MRPVVHRQLIILFTLFGASVAIAGDGDSASNLAATNLRNTVGQYESTVDRIITSARKSNDSYMKLQELCDDIGHRLSGSASLDLAIEWALEAMKKDGHENVRTEPVTVRKWVRGKESCRLVEPRPMRIEMLGLGGSVGTGVGSIKAETLVVDDKEELDNLDDDDIRGKIVVFNCAMPPYSDVDGSGYGKTVKYRGNSASWAAKRGAVAALVRSVTAYSLVSPHTGAMNYQAGTKKIPTAAISIEAAQMLRRWQNRAKKCVVELSMEAKDAGEAPSANVVGEIVGSELPKEIVVIVYWFSVNWIRECC